MRAFHCLMPVFCISAFIFAGCSKKETMEVDSESQSIVDYTFAEQEYMSLVSAVFRHATQTSSTGLSENYPGKCSPLHYESGDTVSYFSSPRFFIDAASISCSLPDGRARKGKL